MGNVFLGIKGLPVSPAWLLALCFFLSLTRGVDGLTCRRCALVKPGRYCYPPDKICTADEDICFTFKIFQGTDNDKEKAKEEEREGKVGSMKESSTKDSEEKNSKSELEESSVEEEGKEIRSRQEKK
ncbi:hypothetical protein JD844_013375 [Phrynosoma platyrhinos]|uniref:Uncharacterized protein n=1 Tax=Phrynosoma platyrhinos TaxID=52577 RepID=A0ABQ7TKQ5_PHRPL|nr:hypothetical protein JD844_013375 [Phrynosoma platyrhinos]